MNGRINGTMEESTKFNASLREPSIEDKVSSEKCTTSRNYDKSKNLNTENNTHLDKCEKDQKNVQEMADDSANNEAVPESDNEALFAESNSTDLLQNHCSNSKESFLESASTSLSISKTTDSMANNSMDEKCNDEDCVKDPDKTITLDETQISDSESSSEYGSVVSVGPRAEDTVSIDSDSDEDHDNTSLESQNRDKNNDVIIVENDNRPHIVNRDSLDSTSLNVQEIHTDNEDRVVTDDTKSNSNPPIQRRKSSRLTKYKKYDLDLDSENYESDVEEVEMDDPLSGKTQSIVINKAISLVETATNKKKVNIGNKKNEPTVVITDSKSHKDQLSQNNSNVKLFYQSIVARGTTVTPVISKTSTATQSSPQTPPPAILRSLTDDMFVVEAPSFIVPYVYEKPSLKPFREFVDKLGKELEEQRNKEENERQDKVRQEKQQTERKEGRVVVLASEDKAVEEENKKKKAEKRERRRCRKEDDDASWDGESTSESDDDETLSDEDTVILKDKADSIEEIKEITDLSLDKVSSSKSDSYFDCSLGNFFMNIGLNLVQEHAQADLLKQQSRKLWREKKKGLSTKETQCAIASLMKSLEFSKENNAPYAFTLKKCEFCSFKTESLLALNYHLETPHMKNNLYKCNFCEYEVKSPHNILTHMEIKHQIRGKLDRAPSYHQCTNCPYEDNGKGKLLRHQVACAKKFKSEQNLAPPIEWEPPAKIPKITRAGNNMPYQQNTVSRLSNTMVPTPINVSNLAASFVSAAASGFRARGSSPLDAAPRAPAPVPRAPAPVPRAHNNPPAAGLLPNNYKLTNTAKSKSHQPSISITPLPRLPPPTLQTKNTFVICEICDGYIKDLEQLRNHMQWIHKVKIHPKMIYNRPPLNCQKCQFRFFTDQGLERHLLGSHGLVTSSMQEAANKGKDAGRCPVCGRVYQWKLLSHVARDHNLTLKPAHLSYKCTVCTATFSMYKQFENHVYSAHSVVAKRVMDKSKMQAPSNKPADKLPKSLKINDQITIIPHPAKPATSTKSK